MRRTITLAATLLLVVGGLATAPAAAAGATDAVAAGTTAVDAQADDELRVTDYELHDRRLEPGEALELTAQYRATGDAPFSTDLRATIDGETMTLGRASVDPGNDSVTVQASDGWIDVECDYGGPGDDYFVKCKITVDVWGSDDGEESGSDDDGDGSGFHDVGDEPGFHDVGVGNAGSTTVAVLPPANGSSGADGAEVSDGSAGTSGGDAGDAPDGGLRHLDYSVDDPTLEPGEPLSVSQRWVAPGADGGASDATGKRAEVGVAVGDQETDVGTLSIVDGGDDVAFEPSEAGAAAEVVVDCEWVDDGHLPYLDCETIELDLDALLLAAGDDGSDAAAAADSEVHVVSAGGGSGTPVVRTGELDDLDRGFEVGLQRAADGATNASAAVEATVVGTGTEAVSGDLVATVDGERHELGTLRVDPGDETVEVAQAEQASGWEVSCEFGYSDENGWYVTCEISYESTTSAQGDDVDVSVDDAGPATTTTSGEGDRGAALSLAETTLASSEIERGEPLEIDAVYQGSGSGVATGSIAVAYDETERTEVGTVRVDTDAESATFETTEAARAAGWDVVCTFDASWDDGWSVTCELTHEVSGLEPGDHQVTVGDAAPATVTVQPGNDHDPNYDRLAGVLDWFRGVLGL